MVPLEIQLVATCSVWEIWRTVIYTKWTVAQSILDGRSFASQRVEKHESSSIFCFSRKRLSRAFLMTLPTFSLHRQMKLWAARLIYFFFELTAELIAEGSVCEVRVISFVESGIENILWPVYIGYRVREGREHVLHHQNAELIINWLYRVGHQRNTLLALRVHERRGVNGNAETVGHNMRVEAEPKTDEIVVGDLALVQVNVHLLEWDIERRLGVIMMTNDDFLYSHVLLSDEAGYIENLMMRCSMQY